MRTGAIRSDGPRQMLETFGERLTRLRLGCGYTVAELARVAFVSEGNIRALEAGRTRNPALDTGLRIANALGVSPFVLTFGKPEPPTFEPMRVPGVE